MFLNQMTKTLPFLRQQTTRVFKRGSQGRNVFFAFADALSRFFLLLLCVLSSSINIVVVSLEVMVDFAFTRVTDGGFSLKSKIKRRARRGQHRIIQRQKWRVVLATASWGCDRVDRGRMGGAGSSKSRRVSIRVFNVSMDCFNSIFV
eukprot:GABV01002029.1.p2 GENE.GABV01002029.1~~GABV01002029.1.p2  ORF type:complete len:147 (+),score=29.36 GABV01002029.1:1-441(+)